MVPIEWIQGTDHEANAIERLIVDAELARGHNDVMAVVSAKATQECVVAGGTCC